MVPLCSVSHRGFLLLCSVPTSTSVKPNPRERERAKEVPIQVPVRDQEKPGSSVGACTLVDPHQSFVQPPSLALWHLQEAVKPSKGHTE
uniref:Putative secreted protein n=1 Tax=Anopheles darlingi TaxID=43151 RepID=A0A2M4DBE7_ANODA